LEKRTLSPEDHKGRKGKKHKGKSRIGGESRSPLPKKRNFESDQEKNAERKACRRVGGKEYETIQEKEREGMCVCGNGCECSLPASLAMREKKKPTQH